MNDIKIINNSIVIIDNVFPKTKIINRKISKLYSRSTKIYLVDAFRLLS